MIIMHDVNRKIADVARIAWRIGNVPIPIPAFARKPLRWAAIVFCACSVVLFFTAAINCAWHDWRLGVAIAALIIVQTVANTTDCLDKTRVALIVTNMQACTLDQGVQSRIIALPNISFTINGQTRLLTWANLPRTSSQKLQQLKLSPWQSFRH